MHDERKSKSRLIEELAILRRRVAELEKLENEYKLDAETWQASALVDELTGLYNRKGFLILGQQLINICNRTKNRVLLLFMDLDSLKEINDNFGHAAGDSALVDFAGIVKQTFRKSDVICRWGGDEFIVVGSGMDSGSINVLINRMRGAIAEHNLQKERPFKLSFSAGCSFSDPEQSCDINELLQRADEAMYQAKASEASNHRTTPPA